MNNEHKILLGSTEFKSRLENLAKSAHDRFYVQTMTFEGDKAGEWLIDIMLDSPATEKLLLIDDYSNWVVNDTFLNSPAGILNPHLRAEYRNALKLISMARDFGIKVQITNPIGWRLHRYPMRNHKKSIIVDQVCLIGGINFSDHNFEWHDMMVQFENTQLVENIAHDILKNSSGVTTSGYSKIGTEELFFLNPANTDIYSTLFDKIQSSTQQIDVFSPYLSDPLLTRLSTISEHTEIHIYTPGKNNKGIFGKLLRHELKHNWFTLHQLPGEMSHLKAILIDHRELIIGSSNFDFASYFFEEEIVIATTDQNIIKEFIQKVKLPIKSNSELMSQPEEHPVLYYLFTKLYSTLTKFDLK